MKTLAAALWAYWHAGSFKEGILSIVNAGGDADTNAAVAGALLGAKYGYEGIPAPYRSSLLRKQELYGDATSFLNFCLPGRVSPVN